MIVFPMILSGIVSTFIHLTLPMVQVVVRFIHDVGLRQEYHTKCHFVWDP